MEIKGVIIAELPPVTGQGSKGQWSKQEYILEVPGQYSKKVCFSLWGDKINEYNLGIGQQITAHIDVESREYNSRWYTEVKAWKVEVSGSSNQGRREDNPSPPPTTFSDESNDDDLPF